MTGAKYHQNHKIRRSVFTLPAYIPLCLSVFGDFLLLPCSNAKWSKLKGKWNHNTEPVHCTSRFWKRGKSSGPEGRYWNAWHWKIKRNASSWERKECTKLQLVFNSSAKRNTNKTPREGMERNPKRKQNHESRIQGMKIKTVSTTASSRNKLGFNGKELSKSRKYIHADVVINIKTKVLSRCEFFFSIPTFSQSVIFVFPSQKKPPTYRCLPFST